MVVLGGRSDPDEFSSDVLLYQVNCNAWLLPDLTRKSIAVPGSPVVGPPLIQSQLGPFRPTGKAPAVPFMLSEHPWGCPPFSFLFKKFIFLLKILFKNVKNLIIKVIIFIVCNL